MTAAPRARSGVTIVRAWPGKGDATVRTVEGRDAQGRLRAGTIDADGGLVLLPHGVDPRLPALEELVRGDDTDLVVHRAGRRAVLRCGDSYVKVVRPGRAGPVAHAARAGAVLAGRAGIAAPQVLDVTDDTVTVSVLPGRPAHELSDDEGWEQLWDTWASSWTRLQQQPVADLPALPRHTWADEASVLRDWAGRAAAAGVLPSRWTRLVEEVAGRVASQPQGPHVLTHRDLHDKQLLWDGRCLGVLDLDTLCLADPVLDPANLSVHADLRRAQGLWGDVATRTVVAAARRVAVAGGGMRADMGADEGEDEGGDDGAEDRLRTAELATVARLVCVYAFRPRWSATVLAWARARMRDLS